MRILLTFVGKDNIRLPIGYNSFIQALLYKKVSKISAKWLHDVGYSAGRQSFKFFTFSNFLEAGKFDDENKTLTFPKSISFLLSSPMNWFLEQITSNLFKDQFVHLGYNKLMMHGINIVPETDVSSTVVKIKMLTPVTLHRTLQNNEGDTKTEFFSPFNSEFSDRINNNLRKKWEALHKNECYSNIKISPLFEKCNDNEKCIYFGSRVQKRTVVKGWMGQFLLEGDINLIRLAYQTGIGSRNSQGFGMFDILQKK